MKNKEGNEEEGWRKKKEWCSLAERESGIVTDFSWYHRFSSLFSRLPFFFQKLLILSGRKDIRDKRASGVDDDDLGWTRRGVRIKKRVWLIADIKNWRSDGTTTFYTLQIKLYIYIYMYTILCEVILYISIWRNGRFGESYKMMKISGYINILTIGFEIIFRFLFTEELQTQKFDEVLIHFISLAKEFTAATHIMQSSSNELSTLVSGKAKM